MALLNVISPNFHPKLPSFPHCKRDPHVDVTRTRFFSLRKGSHTLRCAQEEAVLIQYADEETVELKYAEERVAPSTQILGWGEPVKKSDFPKDFLFGAGSSAVQTEGAWDKDGKGPSVWDHYAQQNNLPNVDDAIKSYDFYKEDIKLLKHMGMKTYRFSIAWPRILPKGSLRGGINDAGIKHYQNFIKELKDNHIEPFVTLFHFDYPQALEDEYGGLLSRRFVDDFTDYCDICFANFGKDVKYWTLINEPNNVAKFGYDIGGHPPSRGSIWSASAGNSAREPYIATHHLILAHAAGSKLYRDKYKEIYHDGKGEIGISLSTAWIIPQSDSLEDKRAAERQREFDYGWYLGPLYDGDYPEIMKSLIKDRLPDFTPEEKEMIKESIDFLGVNYYTASFVRNVPITDDPPISYCRDSFTESLSVDQDGNEIAPLAEGSLFVRVYPEGLKKLLVYLKGKYENPKIIVTENGVSTSVKTTPNLSTAYKDKSRTEFIQKHLIAIRDARKEGANVHGYFYWSLMDSFEFFDGYGTRFGLNFTDFTDTKTYARDQKGSAEWFKKFLGNHCPWWP